MSDGIHWRIAPPEPTFEHVAVGTQGTADYPDEYRDRIVIDTVHDGDIIPERLARSQSFASLEAGGSLWRDYVRERDWGAGRIAASVAAHLGLGGYYRVTVARVAVDFNRFPGLSPPDARSLDTMAISHHLSQRLGYDELRHLLEECYDTTSAAMEQVLAGKLIKLSIHTYDERNPSLTQRPEASVLTRSHSYQQSSHLPYGLFDPLFPDEIAASSAKRILRDRIALTLEKAGYDVEHNYPYCLPDGSLEIRSQPWFFFQHLRELFCREVGGGDDPAHQMVWAMLLNTNLRGRDSGTLSAHLHRFRRPPEGRETEFARAREAYAAIRAFLAQRPELVRDYRNSFARTSALAIEVRKDLVWRFEAGEPVGPNPEAAEAIGATIASAIATYLRVDRAEQP